jgi:hypothetical protein
MEDATTAALDAAAAKAKEAIENGTMTQQLLDTLIDEFQEGVDADEIAEEFDKHRDAVCRYLDFIEKHQTLEAVTTLLGLDPPGIISLMGALLRFWGEMLRDGEDVTLGDMARLTYHSMECGGADDCPVCATEDPA